MKFNQRLSFRKEITPAIFAKMMLDPVLIIVSMFLLAVYFDHRIERTFIMAVLLVFALAFPGGWSRVDTIRAELIRILSSWPLFVAVLWFFGYATGYLDMFSQDLLLSWVIITPIVMLLAHVGLTKFLTSIHYTSHVMRTAVIVGANKLGLQVRDRMLDDPVLGLQFQGFFDDRSIQRLGFGEDEQAQHLGALATLSATIRLMQVDVIYIALPMTSQPRLLKLLDDLKDTTTSIYFVPDIFMFDLIQARLDDLAGIPVVAVCETPFSGTNGLVKRISDVVIASMILILISPILLILAIGVKLSSSGPIIFQQRRYGLDGQDIIVYKFRSMTVTENGDKVVQATRNDQRITPFGRFIRKTSLDELPQFINVLQGRMSIVGPRPHAVSHNEMYRKLIKGYMIRHKVKPGITGWAQVNGYRGETESIDKMKARIDYDLDYLRHWSLSLDMKIIAKTIALVFFDRSAY